MCSERHGHGNPYQTIRWIPEVPWTLKGEIALTFASDGAHPLSHYARGTWHLGSSKLLANEGHGLGTVASKGPEKRFAQ